MLTISHQQRWRPAPPYSWRLPRASATSGGRGSSRQFHSSSPSALASDEFRDSLFAVGQDHPNVAWKHADLVRESVRRRFGERLSTDHARAIAQLIARTYGDRIRPVGGLRRGGSWQIHEWTRLEFVTQETETVNVDTPEEEIGSDSSDYSAEII